MRVDIQPRMEEQFPLNTHPIPIATAWDGTIWTVDLAARYEEMDLDVTATSPDLHTAEDKAYQRITKSHTMYRRYGYVPN